MPRILHLLIVVALLLAVPLRGLAASGMPLCHSQSPDQHAAAEHHQAHAGDHGHAHDHDDASPHQHGDDESSGPSVCSACGASCSAVMAPMTAGLAAPFPPPSTAIAFVGSSFSGFTPGVADRPPLL